MTNESISSSYFSLSRLLSLLNLISHIPACTLTIQWYQAVPLPPPNITPSLLIPSLQVSQVQALTLIPNTRSIIPSNISLSKNPRKPRNRRYQRIFRFHFFHQTSPAPASLVSFPRFHPFRSVRK